jgi:hypothetical protein
MGAGPYDLRAGTLLIDVQALHLAGFSAEQSANS